MIKRDKIKDLPPEAFGIVPTNLVPVRNIMTSIPGLSSFVNRDEQGARESINNLTINLAMMSVQKTKGPISDTEMKLFIGGIPNMAQTKEGVYSTLQLMETLNAQIVKFSDARATAKDEIIKAAIANGDNASTVSDKLTRWEIQWRKDNPVFDKTQEDFIMDNYNTSQNDPILKAMGDDAYNKIQTNSVSSILNPPKKKSSTGDKSVDDMTPEELRAFIAENM